MTINRKICPAGLRNNPNRIMKSINYVTIHCTGNRSASATAASHANYQHSGSEGRQASWHYTVDKNEIWQSFEDNQECWHATDGNGPGNTSSIGIEICVNDQAGFKKACDNAAWLVSELLKKYGLSVDKVVQHNKWYPAKDCPSELRSGVWGVSWENFVLLVRQYMGVPHADSGLNQTTGTQASAFMPLTNAEIASKALELVRPYSISTGLFPSVKAAQMLLESGCMKSELAQKANNCFGMKTSLSGNAWACSSWDGVSICTKETTENKADGTPYTVKADFRKYACIEDSIADHSAYLLGAKNGSALRYAGITKCKNYREQIQLIKDGGYATDVKYVDKVCAVIEQYKLDRYDASVIHGTTITLAIGSLVLDVPAENVGGHWYVTMPDGVTIKIRDILDRFGCSVIWEESCKTIIAAKK